MEITAEHIFGPVFATVAMFFYGRAIVGRASGRQIRILPALILIMGALLFQILTTDGTIIDVVCRVLLSFGVAMIIDSRYLAAKKEHPKMFWVPGLLALMISFVLYFFASLAGYTSNGFFAGDGAQDIESGQVLIELGPDDAISELEEVLEKYGAEYGRAFPMVDLDENEDLAQTYLVRLPQDQVDAFLAEVRRDTENVDHSGYNSVIRLNPPSVARRTETSVEGNFLANDPQLPRQWWIRRDGNAVHQLLRNARPKKKARVAIVDTGIDSGHEDLRGIFSKSPADSDIQGHGTHCAGLAGAATNNGVGIASYNWEGRFVEVRGYKGLSDDGSGSVEQVSEAIILAAEDGADVISLSLGSKTALPPFTERAAIEYALQRGCIVVAAAGNNRGLDAREHSPSNIPGVIAVAATNAQDRRAPFSNINTKLKMPLAAPGMDIFSTLPAGKYESYSGTSMATPIVAGVIGIMRAFAPDLSPQKAWRILHDTGREIEDSHEVGKLIQPAAAIKAVL
ncbi:MAG: S8 family serine peptidase [Bacteroidota bacterium]